MNEYMMEAIKLAKSNLSSNNGGPFGAIVVKDGKVIGRGSNMVLKMKDPSLHAEVVAIRDACKNIDSYDLKGCTLYTSCYPCPMCMSLIIWANIDKVYYASTKEDADSIGFRDDFIYEYFKGNKESDLLKLECIDREENLKVFSEFLDKEDKVIY